MSGIPSHSTQAHSRHRHQHTHPPATGHGIPAGVSPTCEQQHHRRHHLQRTGEQHPPVEPVMTWTAEIAGPEHIAQMDAPGHTEITDEVLSGIVVTLPPHSGHHLPDQAHDRTDHQEKAGESVHHESIVPPCPGVGKAT